MVSRWMNNLLYVFIMFTQNEPPSWMTVVQRWLEKHLKFFCLRTRKTTLEQRWVEKHADTLTCLKLQLWICWQPFISVPNSTITSFLPFRKNDAMSTESLNTQRSCHCTLLIPAAFRWSMSISLQPKLFWFPVKKLKVHGFTEGFHQSL